MTYQNEDKAAKPAKTNGENSGGSTSIIGNRIYFYTGVDDTTVLDLVKKINEWTIATQKDMIDRGTPAAPAELFIHVNSGGGSLYSGLAAMDNIANSHYPVNTIVEGRAASAATLISISGSKRTIRKNSYMLIHQISTGFWGKFEEMKDEISNMEKFHKTLKNFYETRTKIPPSVLDEILKRDLYLDSAECLNYGLVDAII